MQAKKSVMIEDKDTNEKYDFDEIINKIQSKTKYRPDILDEIYMYDF